MWVAKIKFSGERALLGSRAKKFNVSLSGYPVSFYEKKDGIYLYLVAFLFGEEKNKKRFIQDLKKEKQRVLHIENKGDFIIGQFKEPLKFKPAYNPKIMHIEPIIIKEDSTEIWTLGSWNKKELMGFVGLVEKIHGGELLKIKQEKITNFSIISMQPELTLKQKKAIELAIKHGYYDYPKKIELEKLAKLMKLSRSTYQAHLRKAEKKLMPFFFEKTK